jgi:hypothetical protein
MSFGIISGGDLMNVRTSRLSFWPIVILVVLGLMTNGELLARDDYASIIKAAEVARRDFSVRLKQFPSETEFDKFVENIDNYSIGLSEGRSAYVIVFKLRKGEDVVKGGGAIYNVRKKDLAIVRFVGQE